MRNLSIYVVGISAPIIGGVILLLMLFAFAASTASADESKREINYDELEPIENSRVAKSFIDPDVDFSVYKRVQILKTYVAFQENWRRDQNREQTQKISADDVERIKEDVAALFEEVFTEVLEADGGFEVVDVKGEDVLLLRAAIIDLDIATPDLMGPDRSTVFTTTSGAATLYIEFFDSESGRIIGRSTDRQALRDATSSVSLTNRAMNAAEGRRVFKEWAELLRTFLDEQYENKKAH